MAKINEIDITSLLFQEGSAPSTPASTKWRTYFKTDGLYVIDDAGTETGPLGSGGGGSDPLFLDGTYTDAGLSDEFDDTTGNSGSSNGLNGQWTAVNASAGTVDLLATSTLAAPVYDLSTYPSAMLIQMGSGQDPEMRIDAVPAAGEEITACIEVSPGLGADNNDAWYGIGVNDSDTQLLSGNATGMLWDGAQAADILRVVDTSVVVGANAFYPTPGMVIFFRMVRIGDVWHNFVSSTGRTWRAVNTATVTEAGVDNFWLSFTSLGTWTGSASLVKVNWVRHHTYDGYIPEWAS